MSTIERPQAVKVDTGEVTLDGDLTLPAGAAGLVIFAHGSGSSRKSSRNRYVAAELVQRGLATLLFDLLTAGEEAVDVVTAAYRFDIERLTRRLVGAAQWAQRQPELEDLPIGFFGASTGGAAAIRAAAALRGSVGAVVSRGGRPDLAGEGLELVRAPTLLIVGGHDPIVIDLNREALREITAEKELVIVPGATHLFEEPGALEEVARLAGDWFVEHLASGEADLGRPAHEPSVESRAEP